MDDESSRQGFSADNENESLFPTKTGQNPFPGHDEMAMAMGFCLPGQMVIMSQLL
jgi:hypothetical protein